MLGYHQETREDVIIRASLRPHLIPKFNGAVELILLEKQRRVFKNLVRWMLKVKQIRRNFYIQTRNPLLQNCLFALRRISYYKEVQDTMEIRSLLIARRGAFNRLVRFTKH